MIERLSAYEKGKCTAKFLQNANMLCTISTRTNENGSSVEIHLQDMSRGLKEFINLPYLTLYDDYFDIAGIDGVYEVKEIGIRFYWTPKFRASTVGFSVKPDEGIFDFTIGSNLSLIWNDRSKNFKVTKGDLVYHQELNRNDMAIRSALNTFVGVMVEQHRKSYGI